MRPMVIVLVGFSMLALSAASAHADKNSAASETGLAAALISLYADGDGCSLSLDLGRGDGGGTIGIDGLGLNAFRNVVGTCEDTAATLAVAIPPAPLCATHFQSGSNMRLSVMCSGPSDRVIGAIGALGKAMLLLP